MRARQLLNEPAVIEALQSGQLGGLALDVYAHEPVKDSPLATLPNVILTPHIAGSTHEAQEAVGVQIALQVREYLTKGVIQNAVNVPSISEEEYEQMLPYVRLGERLGTFLAQSSEGGVEEIGLSYSGEIAEWKTALIRNAAVAGALNQLAHAHERANLVNAASLAEERGIRLTERKKQRDAGTAAANVLRVTFKNGQQENTVAGTVQPGGQPRLLEIDGIHVEAPLEGNVIYLRNLDVPGVVGRVGRCWDSTTSTSPTSRWAAGARGGRPPQPSQWCRWTARSSRRCSTLCAASRRLFWPRRLVLQRRSRREWK